MTVNKKSVNNTEVLAIVAIILIILSILWLNSFRLALMCSGFGTEEIIYIYSGIDDNGHETCVIAKKNQEQYEKIGLFTKNAIGIWKESYSAEKTNEGIISFSWMRISGLKAYKMTDIQTEWENHIVYLGNNAVNPIPDLNGFFPENTVVSVDQSQNVYRIHIVCYGDAIQTFEIDICELLRQLNTID